MSGLLVHVHLIGLVVVELLPDGGLVLWRQARPRFVCAAVVLVTGGHLDVVVEFDNLWQKKERLFGHEMHSTGEKKILLLMQPEGTFLFLSSSTVGRKLSFLRRYRFFSSRSFFSSSLVLSGEGGKGPASLPVDQSGRNPFHCSTVSHS